jgi:AraC-like DNA-binding protein
MPSAAASRSGARFGEDMEAAFGGPRKTAIELHELRFGPFSVMDVRCDAPGYGRSAPIPPRDALLIALQLRANAAYDIWLDGKRLDCLPVRPGMVNVYDLRGSVVSASAQPFHSLTFTLPLRPIDGWDDDDGAAKDLQPGQSRTALYDPVIEGLGLALRPALEHPERASNMFVEHVLLAMRAHLSDRMAPRRAPRHCGLSARQLRRVRDHLDAHLGENVSLTELAASCSLSAAHFARGFRLSMGMPPHRYLVHRRVARARELLEHTKLPLSDIAVRCGFADQSHLTKTFRRMLGVTPGSLRRAGR